MNIDTGSSKNDCQWKLWSDALSDLTKTFNGISQEINITSACADLLMGTGDSAQHVTKTHLFFDLLLTISDHSRELRFYGSSS